MDKMIDPNKLVLAVIDEHPNQFMKFCKNLQELDQTKLFVMNKDNKDVIHEDIIKEVDLVIKNFNCKL